MSSEGLSKVPLTGNAPVGGINSGKTFDAIKDVPVRDLKIWSGKNSIIAVEIGWGQGLPNEVYGDTADAIQAKAIVIDPFEHVKRVLIWRDNETASVAYLEIETSKSQKLSIGSKPEKVIPVDEEIGTGILMAVVGTVSKELQSIAFRFISGPMQRVQTFMEDIKFDTPPGPSEITSVSLTEQDFTNDHTSPVNWAFSKSVSVTSTQEWKHSRTEEFAGEVSMSGGFLGIDLSASASWSESETTEHGKSWSNTEGYDWSLDGVLQPGESIRVRGLAALGSYSGSYTYTRILVVEEDNGAKWKSSTINLEGWYSGGLYAKSSAVVGPIPSQ